MGRQRESLARLVPHGEAGGHGPHLQHAQLRLLEAELDVDRVAVGALDAQRRVDQLAQFRVSSAGRSRWCASVSARIVPWPKRSSKTTRWRLSAVR